MWCQYLFCVWGFLSPILNKVFQIRNRQALRV
jgi:diadenosine tetraphosphatase ApaH/serine/threonine PP2A family protein phosphatase